MNEKEKALRDEVEALRRLVIQLSARLGVKGKGPISADVEIPASIWGGLFAGLALPQLIASADPDETAAQTCGIAVEYGAALCDRLHARYGGDDDDTN